jgi:hypothetical protein
MPRKIEIRPAGPGEPAAFRLRFYGGVVDVGVDEERQFVSVKIEGDLERDEPLYLPGEGLPVAQLELPGVPLLVLRDKSGRVIGVHVTGTYRARRLGPREP